MQVVKSRLISAVMSAAVLVSLCCPAFSESSKLAERTTVKLRTTQNLTSGKVKTGGAVSYTVGEDVKDSQGRVLIKYGAHASGKVTKSSGRGMFGKNGKLEFTVESVEAVDGTQVPLRSSIENSGKNNTGAVIVAALLLTVLAVFINGHDITVKEGTEIMAYVDHDTMINEGPASTAVTPAVSSVQPQIPNAKLSLTPGTSAGSSVVSELSNEGPDPSGAEITILVQKDGKGVGAGTLKVDIIGVGEKRICNVPIQGSTDGSITVDVKPIPVIQAANQTPTVTNAPASK